MNIDTLPFYKAFREQVSERAIKDITVLLVGMAKTGNVEAAKVVLQFALGLSDDGKDDELEDKT